MKNYTTQIQEYTQPGIIESNCNEIAFVNTGISEAQINGFRLAAGDSLSISGNSDENDKSNYTLTFDNSSTNSLTAIRKVYDI